MSRLQQIIDILHGEKPKEDKPDAIQQDCSIENAIKILEALAQRDSQKAFRDSFSVMNKIREGNKFERDISEAMKQGICLARECQLSPGCSMSLRGFGFTREGYFPCAITVSCFGGGVSVPKGHRLNGLTPWNGNYSPTAVAECAFKLLELYKKFASESPLNVFIPCPVEEIAESILRATETLESLA